MRIKKSRVSSIKTLTHAVREERNRITEQSNQHNIAHLRKKIREILLEDVMEVTQGYGGYIGVDIGDQNFSIGELIVALLAAEQEDFFITHDGYDNKSLENLLTRHQDGVQGGMENWDTDVFSQYYNVSIDKVINNYAELNGHTVEAVSEGFDEDEDDGTNDFESTYS